MLKIMLVDDEENVLNAYRRNIRGQFVMKLFNDPINALNSLKDDKEYSVVVSDFNMPGMKGLEFLKKFHEINPDTVKILLTGYADLQLVINAINEGYIFRFLTKPCESENLIGAIKQGINQFKLITAEKELLEKTLRGSVKVLIDILSVSNPAVFNRASLMRDLAKRIIKRLSITETWEIDIAILLSQIGCVGIPSEIVEKRIKGIPLDAKEEEIYYSHAEIGSMLLKNIPRLEKISQAISLQFKSSEVIDSAEHNFIESNVLFIAKLLRLLNDFFWIAERGIDHEKVINYLNEESYLYDALILGALEAEIKGAKQGYITLPKQLNELKEGMILAENLSDSNNYLLLPKGTVLSDIYIHKLITVSQVRQLPQQVKVFVKA
ncbi:MAG: HD domain-containing phosphohydrolase [Stygiobacter sp.]|jgi:FixJ family two-component response regulator|uniref:Response regulator n=1 Tax=Stygiobacter electus TaxID=3032292 RepID=A0AAE3NYA6_9BACT|nr:HD domain-containing phosphohydrolase [Stygiobacter electus]MDF1610820.1 response regulator [Stygiobacter electus]